MEADVNLEPAPDESVNRTPAGPVTTADFDPSKWSLSCLKTFCEHHGLRRGGKKSDVLTRVVNYLSTSRSNDSSATRPTAQSHSSVLLSHAARLALSRHPAWPDQGWRTLTQGRLKVPRFSMATMLAYFVMRRVAADLREAADFSSISDKAYRLFDKGYVQTIEVNSSSSEGSGLFFVRAKVHPQMKDGKYDVDLVVGCDGKEVTAVEWAKCGCPAGKGPHASCKHIASLFYALEQFCRLGYTEKESVTSHLQQWNIPRKRVLHIREAEELDLCRPRQPPMPKREAEDASDDKELQAPQDPKHPRAPRQSRSFYRDPRPQRERGKVLQRLWPAMEKLEAAGVELGLSFVVRSAKREYKEKEDRLQKRDQLQEPWLQLRKERKGNTSSQHTGKNTPGPNEARGITAARSSKQLPGGEVKRREDTGITSDWLSAQTAFLASSLSFATPNISQQPQPYTLPEAPPLRNFLMDIIPQVEGIAALLTEKAAPSSLAVVRRGPVVWGGRSGDIFLDNTCPLDNFLAIFWVACHNSPLVRARLAEQPEVSFTQHLNTVLELVGQGRDADAKVAWAEYLHVVPNDNNVLNLHGSEHERFVRHFNDTWMRASVKSVCQSCGHEQERHVKGITLGNAGDYDNGRREFEVMFAMAMCPPPNRCRLCGGERVWADRVFTVVPPVLILELTPEVAVTAKVKALADIPPFLTIPADHFASPLPTDSHDQFVPYLLIGATYADGSHYRGAFLATEDNTVIQPSGWYRYDGLCGHERVGLLPPSTPGGSHISYIVFTQLQHQYYSELARFNSWYTQSSH